MLSALLEHNDESVPLDQAALELAFVEFPGLDPAPCLATLDRWAVEIGARLPASADGLEYVSQANRFLFEQIGLRGDRTEYYHPRNSCLNHVLDGRVGLPITLAVVYMEIARRLGRPVSGIGLPGHFVAKYDDGAFCAYVDVFESGRMMIGADAPIGFPSLTKRQILIRMLSNLRNAYQRRNDLYKLMKIIRLLLSAGLVAPERERLESELRALAAFAAGQN